MWGKRLPGEEKKMTLHETLQICLLALDVRYPEATIDINEDVLGPQADSPDGWSALELLDLLQVSAPDLLRARACLRIDDQESNIYLEEYADHVPAFFIHCRGKLPLHRKHIPAEMVLR
jgi:hypothetical protein